MSLIQEFSNQKFNWPPLENFTGTEAQALEDRLKRNCITFPGGYFVYKTRWNEPLPNRDELQRQWGFEKIWHCWEEKTAYESRGSVTGIQVATDGGLIKRVRFAYKQIFEEWRATSWAKTDEFLGEGGKEQDPLLLEAGEQVVEVTTYTVGNSFDLSGLEMLTSAGRQVSWGKNSKERKRSVTKDTALAFCSGGVVGGEHFCLTFHWEHKSEQTVLTPQTSKPLTI